MKSIIVVCCFILMVGLTHAQSVDLRKLTMKSDVILLLETRDAVYTQKYVNDYTVHTFLTIKRVESIIKNEYNIKLLEKEFRSWKENEDFYSDEKINVVVCRIIAHDIIEFEKKYYQLVFLKKENKQHVVIATLWNNFDWPHLTSTIESIMRLEDINNLNERYRATLDWFIERNQFPDDAFIQFYTQKGLLKNGSIKLSDDQLLQAKTKFLAGSEQLYELIADRYPEEIKEYYLGQLIQIWDSKEDDWSNCCRFQNIYEILTKTRYECDETDQGKLKDRLTDDDLSDDEKRVIMTTLIDYLRSTK